MFNSMVVLTLIFATAKFLHAFNAWLALGGLIYMIAAVGINKIKAKKFVGEYP